MPLLIQQEASEPDLNYLQYAYLFKTESKTDHKHVVYKPAAIKFYIWDVQVVDWPINCY